MKRIVRTNILLFILIIVSKLWLYIELHKDGSCFETYNFIDFQVWTGNDTCIGVPDFSVFIIFAGLIINFFYLYMIHKNKIDDEKEDDDD